MTLATTIKFIHVLCGVTFFGIVVASFFYLAHSIKQKNRALIRYALAASFFADALIAVIVAIQFYTATRLITLNHLSVHTPWIAVAYIAFSVVAVLWLLSFAIRCNNYRRHDEPFRFKHAFYAIYIVLIILFIMIIHDAVMHQTWIR